MPEDPSRGRARPGQEHRVAPPEEAPLGAVDAVDDSSPVVSRRGETWRRLRRRPQFVVPSLVVLLLVVVALFPTWFTSVDPRHQDLARALQGPQEGHPLGFTRLGSDVYARLVHGARASVSVGILTTAVVVVLGGATGALAGYYGGWVDALLSRLADVFFALPLVLGAIVLLQALDGSVPTVALTLALFGWPQVARIARGSVLQVRGSEYVTAARALGLGRFAVLVRHVVPNALGPLIVVATISLGTFIAAEATLSFLGVGLPGSVVSWGGDISTAQAALRTAPQVLLWPSLGLSVTVLSFLLLGDALRDALDPRGRTR